MKGNESPETQNKGIHPLRMFGLEMMKITGAAVMLVVFGIMVVATTMWAVQASYRGQMQPAFAITATITAWLLLIILFRYSRKWCS